MAASSENEITVIRMPLIWLDGGINDDASKDLRKRLCRNFGRCHFAETKEEYQGIFRLGSPSAKYVLIISGKLGEELKDSFAEQSKISTVYVYCGDVDKHRKWARNYSEVIKLVTNDPDELISTIRANNPQT